MSTEDFTQSIEIPNEISNEILEQDKIHLFNVIKVRHDEPLDGFDIWTAEGINDERNIKIWTAVQIINTKSKTEFDIAEFYNMISMFFPHERLEFLKRIDYDLFLKICEDDNFKPYITKKNIRSIIENYDNKLLSTVKNNLEFAPLNITNHVGPTYNFLRSVLDKSILQIINMKFIKILQLYFPNIVFGQNIIDNLCNRIKKKEFAKGKSRPIIDIYVIDSEISNQDKVKNIILDHDYQIKLEGLNYVIDAIDAVIIINKYIWKNTNHVLCDNNLQLVYDLNSKKIFSNALFYTFQRIHCSTDIVLKNKKYASENNTIEKNQLQFFPLHFQKNNFSLLKCDKCYNCKKIFRKTQYNILQEYPDMCIDCALFNYSKKIQTLDLPNRIAFVTGCRIKIGYMVTLELLRSGCCVLGTSRFPLNALQRFQTEPDYDTFKSRLHIYKIDFRDIKLVEQFIDFVKTEYTHLDIVINNAAQTFTYDTEYYQKMITYENTQILGMNENKEIKEIKEIKQVNTNSLTTITELMPNGTSTELICRNKLMMEELKNTQLTKPDFKTDKFGELITKGGEFWNKKLEDVTTAELIEVTVVNQIVPQMFISKFKSMLLASPNKKRYIINVSCQEGRFDANKNGLHAHTNSAKAAMNMITRTLGDKYKNEQIYLNTVDPGYVSCAFSTNTRCPITLKDAAKRILDPIFISEEINDIHLIPAGNIFRHYKIVSW